jgi:hypothetical protein
MLHNMLVVSVCIKCFRCFILYVAKVDLDVAWVCNGFQVFSGILQVFQTFVACVSTVLDVCCKYFIWMLQK